MLGELRDDVASGPDARIRRHTKIKPAVIRQIGKLSVLVVVLQFDVGFDVLLLHVALPGREALFLVARVLDGLPSYMLATVHRDGFPRDVVGAGEEQHGIGDLFGRRAVSEGHRSAITRECFSILPPVR